ncbi:MAG: hypothetical protein MRJ65_05835 [Candidatus Brocadiaceae bacterium]|nr:hypothetical protein [Candidatus Brocadiaceae bacterium]
MEAAKVVTAWMIPVFIGLLGLLVLRKIHKNEISLAGLINESSGEASMSRFQLMVFTFVIAISLFLIIVNSNFSSFPEIPNGVWALLGISGGSYVVSKSIQCKSEEESERILAEKKNDAK